MGRRRWCIVIVENDIQKKRGKWARRREKERVQKEKYYTLITSHSLLSSLLSHSLLADFFAREYIQSIWQFNKYLVTSLLVCLSAAENFYLFQFSLLLSSLSLSRLHKFQVTSTNNMCVWERVSETSVR